MSRPKGSIIGARPTWTTTATSGIWTLRQAEEMKAANQWPRGPEAPTSLAGTPGDGQVALTWTAPATTHGTITDYVVEYTPAAGSPTVVATGSTAASYTLTGLTNDTEYTFRVAGVNHTRGDWSDSVAVTPSSAPTDPDFASVSLLMHFDGNWSDLSNNSYTVTPTSASTSSTKFKFGTESAYFNGYGYADLPVAAHPSGTEDWTIEYWADSDNWAGGAWMRHFGTEGRYQSLRVYSSSSSVNLQVVSASNTIMGASFSPVSGWNHFAFVRQGSTLRAYVNGTQVGSGSYADEVSQPTGGTPGWRLGMWTGNTEEGFVGYIDDFRTTRGVCRYPDGTTFTPPTAAFPDA